MISREPVGPVQVLPPGLTSLLQIKSGGTNPDAMRQDIQPGFDLEAWWLRATRKRIPDLYERTFATGAYGKGVVMVDTATGLKFVSPGPQAWWYVHNATVRVIMDAATVATWAQLSIVELGGPSFSETYSLVGNLIPSIAADDRAPLSANGFWMPPGSFLGVWMDDVVGGGNAVAYLQAFAYSELPL